jgi:hypothetical protein
MSLTVKGSSAIAVNGTDAAAMAMTARCKNVGVNSMLEIL